MVEDVLFGFAALELQTVEYADGHFMEFMSQPGIALFPHLLRTEICGFEGYFVDFNWSLRWKQTRQMLLPLFSGLFLE